MQNSDKMSQVNSQYGKGIEICVSWVKANNGFIPPRAVSAGGNCYVGRAKHDGEYIPGKLVEGHNGVYVCFGGEEHLKNYYEVTINVLMDPFLHFPTKVLVTTNILPHNGLEWKWTSGDRLPKGAIVGGLNGGEPLYIARSDIDGEVVVGKFFAPHGCSYVPYGGGEHRKDSAEVLCCVTKHV